MRHGEVKRGAPDRRLALRQGRGWQEYLALLERAGLPIFGMKTNLGLAVGLVLIVISMALVSCGSTPQPRHPRDTAFARELRAEEFERTNRYEGNTEAKSRELQIQQEIREWNRLQAEE